MLFLVPFPSCVAAMSPWAPSSLVKQPSLMVWQASRNIKNALKNFTRRVLSRVIRERPTLCIDITQVESRWKSEHIGPKC